MGPNIRAIIRRRAAAKRSEADDGPSCKVRKRQRTKADDGAASTSSNGASAPSPKGLSAGDLSRVRDRLAARFSASGRVTEDPLPGGDGAADDCEKKQTSYTPLESQVVAIKERHPNTVLMVECGYRFRFFGEDAELASRELRIMCSQDHNFLTASVPAHRVGVHLERLVSLGHKVGIVRQTESAALKLVGTSKSTVFSRELSALFTKSTLVGEDLQLSGQCQSTGGYLVSVGETECTTPNHILIGIVAVQPTTGEVLYDSFQESSGSGELEQRLESLQPVEIILSEKSCPTVLKTVTLYGSLSREGVRVEHLSPTQFDLSASLDALSKFYSEDDGGIKGELARLMGLPPVVVCCLGSLLGYLATFKLEGVLKDISRFTTMASDCQRMSFTVATLRRLDLFRNSLDGTSKGTLLDVMDHTATAFGRRLLFSWLGQPLSDLGAIVERQDAVENILSSGTTTFSELRKFLSRMPDVQRGLCAILHKKVKPSDTYEILTSLSSARELFSSLQSDLTLGVSSTALKTCISDITELLADVGCHLSLLEAQAAKTNDMARLFRDLSHYPDLAKRRQDVVDVEEKLAALRKTIARQLGLLAFDYKTVSGMPYLIEVPTRRLSSVPSSWLKISSTKAVERFRSPAVDSLYRELCVAQELVLVESRKSWDTFLGEVSQSYNSYQRAVKAIATVDCFLSLARTASQYGYCRPQMLPRERRVFRIGKGRHPILEQRVTASSQYVSNSTDLDEELRCCVITGPNMGGKSSYMRQVALIAIMAHVGSYVPAETATMSLLDGVYVRMGAEDDVSSGKSTFLCEMQETSEILDKCTCHSLVVIDELGRGTATHDGTAIALATLRHLVEEKQCFTLFVTHYLPITEMQTFYKGSVTNCHVAFNVDDKEAVTFFYRLVPGAAPKSYGLNVAALAGVPSSVVARAREKAEALETSTKKRKERFATTADAMLEAS
ncbi:unnamed protein product [Ixodes hexagonus]